MEKWKVKITALQPISIAASPVQNTQWETATYIPASVLRGAIAEEWSHINGFESPYTKALFSEARWRDAYSHQSKLITADYFTNKNGEKMVSVLAAYLKDKQVQLKHNHEVLLPADIGYHNNVIVENQVGIAISPERKSVTASKLYTSSTIVEGTEFFSECYVAKEALLQIPHDEKIDEISFICYIGKKRSSGYGKVRVTFTPMKWNQEEAVKSVAERLDQFNQLVGTSDEWYVPIIGLSPYILLDEYLRPTTTICWETHISPENENVKAIYQNKGQLIVNWGSTSVRHGWNDKWKLPKESVVVVDAGSVSVFKFTNVTKEEKEKIISLLAVIEKQHIGERTNEGFGQVFVGKKDLEITEDSILNIDCSENDNAELLLLAERLAESVYQKLPKNQLFNLYRIPAESIVEEMINSNGYINKKLLSNNNNAWKSEIHFQNRKVEIGKLFISLIEEWKADLGLKRAGQQTKKFIKYIVGYIEIKENIKGD